MRASLPALAAVLLLVAVATLTGCGLKGELYLPETGSSEEEPPQDDAEAD